MTEKIINGIKYETGRLLTPAEQEKYNNGDGMYSQVTVPETIILPDGRTEVRQVTKTIYTNTTIVR